MSVRINLEIGHEASIRTKRTPEGFTHDWEVFVRGCDGAEIQYFVEKVVFYLHETFPKPKRVIKEPPYSVKESGYAGFNLPIEIYLRNKDDPKKVKFHYDLHLQPSGPPLIKVQKEKCVFNLPNEDFKHKLLKGGGSIANVSSSQDNQEPSRSSSDIKNELINKPKLGGSDLLKKHKVKLDEPRISNSFQDLFGIPITKTTKISTELKTISKDINKNSNSKPEKVLEKEKNKDKSKYSPSKEKERDREKSKEKSADLERKKEEKKNKDRNRDRAHSKEKSSKRDRSPRASSPSPKHSPKRISSPKRLTSPAPPPVKQHKEKEEKRVDLTKDKKEKADEKNEKKSKKEKREKDKEHKEAKQKEAQKQNDYKEHKSKEQKQSKEIIKEESPSLQKIERKLKDIAKEPLKEAKEPELSLEKNDKVKTDKPDEKPKHKHKKKDKDRKDKDKDKSAKDKVKDKDKLLIKPPEPIKEVREEKASLFSSPKAEEKPKKASLFSEVENDSSNSSLSSREEPFMEPADKSEQKNQSVELKKPKVEPDKPKKEKSKKSKDKKSEKDEKKRKRKSEKVEDEPLEKIAKEETNSKLDSSDSEQSSNPSQPATEVDKENQENPEDYMQILRELQHKIMTLQDNTELQKVVQLIAKTGRYEVSARTFDFDLCLLEKSTVRQLQEFFASTS